jgi:flagellar biosynthesis protein FlhB
MSLRELKEEFKQTEGDPAIKARWIRCGKSAGAGA